MLTNTTIKLFETELRLFLFMLPPWKEPNWMDLKLALPVRNQDNHEMLVQALLLS
jgi:hypothetical protein